MAIVMTASRVCDRCKKPYAQASLDDAQNGDSKESNDFVFAFADGVLSGFETNAPQTGEFGDLCQKCTQRVSDLMCQVLLVELVKRRKGDDDEDDEPQLDLGDKIEETATGDGAESAA